MKKTFKFFSKILLLLALLIAVVISAVALRLLYSPMGVPYATEMVESETQRLMPGWQVSFDTAEVGWGWSDVRPWVRVDNITVKDPNGKIDAVVDHAWLAISRRDILTSKLIVRSIKLDGIRLQSKSGRGKSDFWSNVDTKQGPKALAPLIESLFYHSSQLNKGMMRISDIYVSNVDAYILDENAVELVNLNIPSIDLQMDDEDIRLSVNGFAKSGSSKIDIRLKASGDIKNKKHSVDWDSEQVNLKDFTAVLKVPEALHYIDAPVAVALSLEADAKVGLLMSDIYVDVGKGQLLHDTAYPVAGEIDFITLESEFDLKSNHFHINKIDGKLKDYELNGEALVYFDDGIARPGIKANIALSGLNIPDLKIYWPNFGSNTAKKWVVDNMTTGSFSNINFLVDVGSDGVGTYRDGSVFDLTFKFRGLDAKYSKTLPIITEAEGYSRYTFTMLDMTIETAQVDGMTLGASHFIMHDLDIKGKAYSLIDVHLAAPMENLLHLTAFAPISLNDRMNIAPERLKGFAITDTKLRIPMIKSLKAADIEFVTQVHGTNIEVHDLLGGEGVRRGTVDLTVDKHGLQASGDILFNGVAMQAKWDEDFVKSKIDGENTTTFSLTSYIDAGDLQAFNVDISNFLDGKMPVQATFTGRNFNITQAHFTADATPAIINVSQMAWQKTADRPVRLSGDIKFAPQEVTISPLIAKGPNIDLSADLYWNTGKSDRFKAEFNVLQLDKNRFTASLERSGSEPYFANISATEIDVSPFLDLDDPENKAIETSRTASTTHIEIVAEKAHFLNGIEATNLTLQSIFTENGPQQSKGKATFASEKDVRLSIFIEDNGTRSLSMTTEDAGALLSGTGLFAHGRGGKMEFNGQIVGWGKTLELDGEAHGERIIVVPVSMLDSLATIGVITGIDEIVGGKGTTFDTMIMPFTYNKGLLDMNGLRAAGGDIGLTLEGQIDYNSQKINMNGVYIPVYGLNSAIGSIPIIGNILTGGKGQGMFGVAYRVKGMIDNPSVSINPLSGIAPGIFRRIFEGGKGKVSDVKDKKPKNTEESVEDPDREKN